MIPRGLETLEFEMFCEHGDSEFHLQRYHEKMALYTDDELLMISMTMRAYRNVQSHGSIS
jgi:hypothetical protein